MVNRRASAVLSAQAHRTRALRSARDAADSSSNRQQLPQPGRGISLAYVEAGARHRHTAALRRVATQDRPPDYQRRSPPHMSVPAMAGDKETSPHRGVKFNRLPSIWGSEQRSPVRLFSQNIVAQFKLPGGDTPTEDAAEDFQGEIADRAPPVQPALATRSANQRQRQSAENITAGARRSQRHGRAAGAAKTGPGAYVVCAIHTAPATRRPRRDRRSQAAQIRGDSFAWLRALWEGLLHVTSRTGLPRRSAVAVLYGPSICTGRLADLYPTFARAGIYFMQEQRISPSVSGGGAEDSGGWGIG